MDKRCGSFTYRHGDKILALGSEGDILLVATSSKLVVWNRPRRKILKEVALNKEIVDIKYFSDGWVLLSKIRVEFLSGYEIKDITPKGPLDVSVVYKNWLLIVGSKEIMVISIEDEDVEVKKTKMESTNGICTYGMVSEDRLFLSFENGKVFCIEKVEIEDIIFRRKREVWMDEYPCLVFLKEPIVSMGALRETLVISLFDRKVLVFDPKTREASFTELPYNIKASTIWNDLIIVGDSKNNVIFLGKDLKAVYSNCLREEICRVMGEGTRLTIGFTVGVVKEYNWEKGMEVEFGWKMVE